VSSDTIRRAAKVTQINMAEAEITLWATDVFENGVAETCAQLGARNHCGEEEVYAGSVCAFLA